jgi:hypothetical protein
MSGEEAHFGEALPPPRAPAARPHPLSPPPVFCMAASRKGSPLMGDVEFDEMKQRLKSKGSWVANRVQDPLERLGVDSFLGYIHQSFRA